MWYLVLLASESIKKTPIRGNYKHFDDNVNGTFAPMFAQVLLSLTKLSMSALSISQIILFLQSLTLPLQGLLNAIVYGWTRGDFVDGIIPKNNPNTSAEDNVFNNQEHYQPMDIIRKLQLVNPKPATHKRRVTHLSDYELSGDEEHYLTSVSDDEGLR